VGIHVLRSGCPERCWDDCLMREAYVRSHTALGIFGLEGHIPESRLKGEPVFISAMAEYAWYEWVTFIDTSVIFPDSKVQLGRYLGAGIDIGPAIASKILKANGEVMYLSLMPDEIQSPTEKKACLDFDIAIEKKLGKSMTKDDFKDDLDFADFETPTYEPYKDDEVPASNMPDIDDVHDVEAYGQYVDTQVRVPIGDEI
jgi:hypothetical protein